MTLYYCPKCKTKDHWANEVCPKEGRLLQEESPRTAGTQTPHTGTVTQERVTACIAESAGPNPAGDAIKQAQDFIRKVGRPKIYPDRNTQAREAMRRYRARKRAKVLGDGPPADVSKPGAE